MLLLKDSAIDIESVDLDPSLGPSSMPTGYFKPQELLLSGAVDIPNMNIHTGYDIGPMLLVGAKTIDP